MPKESISCPPSPPAPHIWLDVVNNLKTAVVVVVVLMFCFFNLVLVIVVCTAAVVIVTRYRTGSPRPFRRPYCISSLFEIRRRAPLCHARGPLPANARHCPT